MIDVIPTRGIKSLSTNIPLISASSTE